MKSSWFAMILMLLSMTISQKGWTQSTANYAFATSVTGSLALDMNGNAVDMSTGTTPVLSVQTSQDQSINSAAIPIGFNFYFGGNLFNSYFATSNGIVQLGSSAVISGSTYTAGSGTLAAPRFSAFNGDLGTGTNGGIVGKMIGTAPNRCYVIEFQNMNTMWSAYTNDSTWQVRFYETTGVVEYVYGTMYILSTSSAGDATPEVGFSWGSSANQSLSLSNINSGTITSASVDRTGTMVQNSVSSSTNVLNLNSSANGSRRIFTFTPPSAPANPIAAATTFTAIGASATTVNWVDNSTSELSFVLTRATDAGFTANVVVTSVASTTTAATGGAYSSVQSGLTPGVTYYYKVQAINEGSLSSGLALGSQITSPPGNITSIATGNWSAPGTWSTGVVPTATDNVTIADGHTVTIDATATATALNLTVGQGASGVLLFNSTAARTITVVGNLTIAEGGTFQTGTAIATHILSIAGNITNNGTLDFNTTTAGAVINFTGSADQLVSGTGIVTDLFSITMSKSALANLVDFNLSNFTVRGLATAATGTLLTSNTGTGTIKFSGSNTFSGQLWSSATYTIPSTLGLWLNNPNFTVTGLAGSPTMSGLLRLTAGTYNVGTSAGNIMGAAATGSFVIDGGTLNIASALSTSNAASFNMSSGTVNVTTVGNASTSPGFAFSSSSSPFTFTGGVINLVQANTNSAGDFTISATSPTLTGGVLNIGVGTTTTSGSNFRISSASLPAMVVDGSNARTATLLAAANAFGDITINSGATLNLNGVTLNERATTFTNNGTLTGSTSSSRLYFVSANNTPQVFAGSGTVTAPLDGLGCLNTGGLTITHSNSIPTLRVNLFAGTITNSNKITLGTGAALAVNVQVSQASNTTTPGGSFDQSPTFNLGTGLYTVQYLQESVARTTGFEIPSTRTVGAVILNNTNGLTIAGGNLTANSALTFTAGLLNTSTNTFILGTDAATPGLLTYTAGGFTYGSSFQRWVGSAVMALGNIGGQFPFSNSGGTQFRHAYFGNPTTITGGWVKVQYNDVNGTTPVSISDIYGVGVRSNSNWVVSTGGGLAITSNDAQMKFRGERNLHFRYGFYFACCWSKCCSKWYFCTGNRYCNSS
ncbi:MAG: fibronectin type III domain-containing protein [Flavobacterium sp.]